MSSSFDALYASIAAPSLDRCFGESVTLQRGAVTTPGVTASWTEQSGKIESPDGSMTTLVDRVWIVKKAAYLIGGVAVEPQKGDRLTDAGGATWEILPSLAGPAVLSYGGGHEWEIKTKLVAS